MCGGSSYRQEPRRSGESQATQQSLEGQRVRIKKTKELANTLWLRQGTVRGPGQFNTWWVELDEPVGTERRFKFRSDQMERSY